MSNTSLMVFPLYLTSNVSRLYLLPLHTSHGTVISGKKYISISLTPAPSHASQRPPLTLKENLPALKPRTLASIVEAKSSLIAVKTPVYVAGLLLGVLPIGAWSIFITLSKTLIFSILLQLPSGSLELFKAFERYGNKIRLISELFPLPETPVTAVKTPVGILTSIFLRLFSFAPLISI